MDLIAFSAYIPLSSVVLKDFSIIFSCAAFFLPPSDFLCLALLLACSRCFIHSHALFCSLPPLSLCVSSSLCISRSLPRPSLFRVRSFSYCLSIPSSLWKKFIKDEAKCKYSNSQSFHTWIQQQTEALNRPANDGQTNCEMRTDQLNTHSSITRFSHLICKLIISLFATAFSMYTCG